MRRGRELDDAVSAALAEVQARQESLSRGSVLPRAASPPAAAHGTSPPTLPKDKTQQRAALFQWLTRRVVRRSGLKDEDVGSLEFVPSASLATVRKLIEQFIALPPRREFAFAHPTTSARVESADEKHVAAAEFQFICIVLLPRRESTATSAVAAETEDLRLRPVTAQFQLQPTQQQTNARPRTVGTNANAKRAAEAATMTDVKVDIVPEKGIREPAQLIMEREKRTLENSAESKREDAPPSRAVGSKRIRGELRLELEDTASRNPERTVKVDPPIRKAVAKQVSTQRSRSASIRSVNEIESKATSEPTLVFPRFGDGCTEQADAQSKYLTPEAAQVYATEIATPESTQDAVDEIVLEQPVKVNIGAENVTSEVQTEKMISQKPGPLRRSRRFRSASIAKLAEIDWGALETEQEEVATDEQVEELIEVIVEAFYTRLPGVDPRQVDAACRYYGIDYQALELQGVLLALDNELGMRCNHVRGGVDGQLTQYLLKKLPVNVDNMQDPEALRHFEHALNLFAGMRGWQAPSRLRATCFEDKQRLQLIASSDTRRFSLLRLSDKDRQLFTLASTGSSAGGLEKWLGDGLEITYVLLYGFLQSRRNSGPKSVAKLDAIFIRQDRIQAAIQKLSCFSLEVWKRLELRTTDIEDVSMVRRLDELLKGFRG
ncbi:uncharacterized protein KRP23_13761 [Phytophthora ramorum]|uniref:uncharacterized protein n=1 Tax=Phytophthora ramorum TaxID=164328 RepID=UPI0030B24782|nr:hypothetical protein KRP23_13761 [Phytophthora ramorum]